MGVMQVGPYIADRLMPKIVAAYCESHDIDFQSFSDEWVLRLQKGKQIRWIVGYKFDTNRSAAGELAQDKVATYAALKAAGISAIPHYLVRSLPHESIHEAELHEALADQAVVVKPLEGTGGRQVEYYESTHAAVEMIRASGEPAWAVSPHLDLQHEYRLIVLSGKVLLAYNKTNPTYRGKLKLFNLNYGAIAADISDTELLGKLATVAGQVMDATGLQLAAVDIASVPDGSFCVVEVNDGISMEHYARQSDEYKNRAANVYGTIVEALF